MQGGNLTLLEFTMEWVGNVVAARFNHSHMEPKVWKEEDVRKQGTGSASILLSESIHI